MNLQISNRRQETPVRLGNHGYRLDGDYALLQAELHVPPYLSGQGFRLELWACPAPHAGGELAGVKIAAHPLDLPTPIGQHTHRVEARAPLSPPLGAGEHAMVLVLVSGTGDTERLHDFANYARFQHFAGPVLDGAVGYSVDGGTVELRVDSLLNRRPEGSVSGSLSLELWALPQPYVGGSPRGQRLAVAEMGSVSGQYHLPQVARRVPFTPPAPGRWHVALLLREWTLPSGYVTRDHRGFDVLYEEPSPETSRILPEATGVAAEATGVAPEATRTAPEATRTAPDAAPLAARPAAKLRLIEPVTDDAAAPASPAATIAAASPVAATPGEDAVASAATAPAARSHVVPAAKSHAAPAAESHTAPVPAAAPGGHLVSVNTASIEELAKLPGASLKVAKEIIKSRPFASLDALLSVRGIGEKTLRRIKSRLTL